MTTRIIKDFTSFGKDQVLSQEMGPEGSNYFVVGYRDPALAARVARRNGELMDGIYRIGVMYQDPRQQPIDGMLPSTTPPPDASLAPASATSPHHLQTRASNVSLANTSALIPNPPKKSTYEWLTGMFVPPPTPAKPLPGQVLPPSLTAPAAAAPTPAAPTAPAAQPWGVTTAVNKVSELVFGW
ncbi:hypothetical protein DACRYDRAFT_99276 [Dacryopinax primogenitus]|uniref:RRM Nup35-type domain-containing protein n=1 Tax=Dacryopinax primogenitus (strain DJM 731) TaxID=1858805 RepID=M5G6A7_DACPD|nr:uncharacterized protein DACRYDRAFT_99276 [Dacryopinax primogenitus]EJU03735.1 hypothetical protein DACRYDRAFT_99276 [Dacryopinax primogenitus]